MIKQVPPCAILRLSAGACGIAAIHPISDGRWTVIGWFTTFDGVEAPLGVVRIGKDGALDGSFKRNRPDFIDADEFRFERALCGLNDGSVLLRTNVFDEALGYGLLGITKLLPDGRVDTTFKFDHVGFRGSSWLANVSPLEDGGALVWADNLHFNSHRVARIRADGTVDEAFEQFIFSMMWGPRETVKLPREPMSPHGQMVLQVSGSPPEDMSESRLFLLRTTNAPRTVIAFESSKIFTSESQTSNVVRLLRFGDTSREESVTVTAEDLTARAATDYVLPGPISQVTFRPLETEAQLRIQLIDNPVPNEIKALRLRISGSIAGTEIERGATLLSIADDDPVGSIDLSFQFNGGRGRNIVTRLTLLPDARIQAYGYFQLAALQGSSFAQLLPDGRLDPALVPTFSSPWRIIAPLHGGRLLIDDDGWLTRLLANFQIDTSFPKTLRTWTDLTMVTNVTTRAPFQVPVTGERQQFYRARFVLAIIHFAAWIARTGGKRRREGFVSTSTRCETTNEPESVRQCAHSNHIHLK